MPRIAISYRRADSAAISGRIFDRLAQHYGAGSVFMDIDEIPFGIDFREHIAQVLSTCDAVVIVIGLRWLGAEGPGRRIDQESDPVRVEVQAALHRKCPLIPVLVEGAAMPQSEELPEPIRPLAFRNACPVDSGRDFHAHVDRLIRSLDRLLGASPTSAEALRAPPFEAQRSPEAPDVPQPHPAALSQPPKPSRIALLAAFLALPQLSQFSQHTPIFLLALFVSTVGAATILDDPRRSTTGRALTAIALMCALLVAQSALGLARASFVSW